MRPFVRLTAKSSVALVVWAVLLSGRSQAEEIWIVRGGTTTVELNVDVLERLGLTVGDPADRSSPFAGPQDSWVFPIDSGSAFTFSISDRHVRQSPGERIAHFGDLLVAGPQAELSLRDWVIEPLDGESLDQLRMTDAAAGRTGGFVLRRVKAGFNHASQTLTIHAGSLHLSPAWAQALGDVTLADHSLGTVTVQGVAEWVGGTEPELDQGAGPQPESRTPGADMTFCLLDTLVQYGRQGDVTGLAVATTSWNVGDADLMWFNMPDEEHPFIVMNVFREKDDRFEQIGQSWIKHGFFALGNTQCGGTCTYEPGHSQGDWLGMGCTDTYSSSLNASQNGMGPRYEVNPWTGLWTYSGSHNSQGSHSHDQIEHRLQVHDDDLDPAQNVGASYYIEGFYVVLDDVDAMNSAAWKPFTVSGAPGGTWTFNMTGSGTPPEIGFAIETWGQGRRTVIAQQVPPIEFVSPDGRCVLASSTSDLGGGTWHYEYALLNIDMDRKVGSFSMPVTPGTIVTNVGFHAVEHHDEGVAGYSNDPWTATLAGGALTWSTVDNPLRWGTLYNFRFDANVPPNGGTVEATLGLFEPGMVTELLGRTAGPEQGPPDCNNNGIVDECDVDCGTSGGPCDVLSCGLSDDCNTNGVPDECEADCNSNGVPDECDVDPGDPDGNGQVSPDCDSNGVPDACDPDSDGDGVPDGCDICPGFDDNVDTDGDGVPDGCDLCPGFDDNQDVDSDGVPDDCDNCPGVFNPGQEDDDQDGIGNLCDPDWCDPAVVDEHFDNDPGWSVVTPSATDGQWDWGIPIGGGDRYDPPDDYDGGGACYLTDNVDGNSDVDGGTTILYSPIYDLSSGNAVLTYAYWIGTNSAGGDDSLVVEVSNDGGSGWTTLATYTANNQQWLIASFTLDAILAVTDQMQFRFLATDGGSASVLEAGIDAFRITANCFPDCNSNLVPDGQDIANGTSADCNSNGVPDECDIADGTSLDCDGGPVGVSTAGATAFSANCAGCHGPDGSGGSGPSLLDYRRDWIWDYLAPAGTAHVGGPFPGFTQQDWADIEAFLASGGSRGRPDLIPDECQTLQDCDSDGITDACELEDATQQDVDYNGVPDDCDPFNDPIRGGLLWDEYWVVNGAPVPTGDHPLYPPVGQQSGSSTYRCKECHGWDYKGVDGTYGSGSHYTGIPGVYGSTMTPQEMFDVVKLDSVSNGHGFENYGLSDQDIWDLVGFMEVLAIDTDSYIDATAQFIGDPVQGETNYTSGGPSCRACHGADGTSINFGTPQDPVWVGTLAVRNPWELLHKIRFGDPAVSAMPSWLGDGGTDQGAADIGRYAQVTFPVDCTGAAHCDDGLYCNGDETCQAGYCVDGPPPTDAGDFNGDGNIDLTDWFTFADCVSGLCETDPCDPPLYAGECCPLADFDQDGDADLEDLAAFERAFGQPVGP